MVNIGRIQSLWDSFNSFACQQLIITWNYHRKTDYSHMHSFFLSSWNGMTMEILKKIKDKSQFLS